MNIYDRQRLLDPLLKERERLLLEEQRAPYRPDALMAWQFADIASGEEARRRARLQELERDILLLHFGYCLVQPVPSSIEDVYRGVVNLTTLKRTRVILQLTREVLHDQGRFPRWWVDQLTRRNSREAASDQSDRPYLRTTEPGLHVRHQCGEVLLKHANLEQALWFSMHRATPYLVSSNGHLESRPDPAIDALIRIEYRSVEGGPESEPLTCCPECHQTLYPTDIQEIRCDYITPWLYS